MSASNGSKLPLRVAKRPSCHLIRCRKTVSEVSLPGSCHPSPGADDPQRSLLDSMFQRQVAERSSHYASRKSRATQRFFLPCFQCRNIPSSARMSRYENGVHEPSTGFVGKLANHFGVPVAYFYCEDGELAEVVAAFSQLDRNRKTALLSSWHPESCLTRLPTVPEKCPCSNAMFRLMKVQVAF